jgi:hypothetical protein
MSEWIVSFIKNSLQIIKKWIKILDCPSRKNRSFLIFAMVINRSHLKKGFWFKFKAEPCFNPQAPEGSALGVNTHVF